ncbi:cellulose synthase-like protein G3 [Cynara cardunculus var. scolymus]|uniref:cellulose synthase-like protein G3 n=1 Tax=Cynara cardunculus var. scolymus TaxID=59895 RepID=UPI000D62AD80|nr:cellulose synthase-like protein G3 [Cynara cardunculus var. scolymus]
MAAPLLHSSKPLSNTWLNRIFILIFAGAVSIHLLRRCRNLIYSPTPISTALFVADFVLAFMWLTCQSFHWKPIRRRVFPENLQQVVAEREYPALDVFICTADPKKEPPIGVVNTVMSVLAFEYPPEKMSVYISDDGGSEVALYAFMEGAGFAKQWIPYCKKHKIVDRSPEVYFGSDPAWFPDTDEIKAMYESMKSRVERVVQNGCIHMESEFREAFRKWTPDFTSRNHPTVIQILLDNNVDKDSAGGAMPNLIYLSRQKSNNKPHNFKAGALNVLLRVSGVMTNSPIVLLLDCDMYSNDPQTPLRALCYFMDPNADPKLGFVQFPQRFDGINKNDIYASEFKHETQILSLGMDGLRGAPFMGTGGFFKRHVISMRIDSKPVKISEDVLAAAYQVASSNYEDNTKWGSKIGFRYGTVTEDTYTSFRLHCEGWKSILCNPKRAAFLGGSPSSLNDNLTQMKRWYMGFLDIFFNKYCPITYGIRSMNPLQALCYTHYSLRSLWSIPIIIYAFLPQLSLINSFAIFPKVSEGGFFLYAFLFLGAYGKDFLDFVVFAGGTMQRWWSYQRMWLIWGLSSCPFALLEWSLKSVGISTIGFNVTCKMIDEEQNSRYEQGLFEFGVESVLFFLISVASLTNLLSLVKGVTEVFMNGRLEELFVQILICGFGVVNSWPIYEGMFLRRDGGRMPLKITLASMATAMVICLVSPLVF